MTEFQQKGYVLVKNFIDPDSVRPSPAIWKMH
jgi:hypothetical protein